MEFSFNWEAIIDIFYSDTFQTPYSKDRISHEYNLHPHFPNERENFITGILLPDRKTIEALLKTENPEKIGRRIKFGIGKDLRFRAQNIYSKTGLHPADAIFLVRHWKSSKTPFRIGPLILPIYKGVPAIKKFE